MDEPPDNPAQTYLVKLSGAPVNYASPPNIRLEQVEDAREDYVAEPFDVDGLLQRLYQRNLIVPLHAYTNFFKNPIEFSEDKKQVHSDKDEVGDKIKENIQVMYKFLNKLDESILVKQRTMTKEEKRAQTIKEKRARQIRKRRKDGPQYEVVQEFYKREKDAIRNARSAKYNGKTIGDVLPAMDAILPVKPQYMANRELFIADINRKFYDYREKFRKNVLSVNCDADDANFKLMLHQEIVRDYMNYFTPNRGLLLYHGLGAGKTCSAIAIAEGLKTSREVYIMTPASLKTNFMHEIKKCGDVLYKYNNHWTFVKTQDIIDEEKNSGNEVTEDEVNANLAKALSLTRKYVADMGGAWMVDAGKDENYTMGLSDSEKAEVNAQIEKMIEAKYYFIHYNGLQEGSENKLNRGRNIAGGVNPFDNKVIIIEESHNLVGMITNKLSDKTPPEKSITMKIYNWLLSAKNVRIIMLSGTPMINYPNELAIMFNILRGNINVCECTVTTASGAKASKQAVEKAMDQIPHIDYVVNYKVETGSLQFIRNPYGFINYEADGVYKGVVSDESVDGINNRQGDEEFWELISKKLSALPKPMKISNKQITPNKLLPDKYDDFVSMFISENKSTGIMKLNQERLTSFKRRIIGMVSYFRSVREKKLMATLRKHPMELPPYLTGKKLAEEKSEGDEMDEELNTEFSLPDVFPDNLTYKNRVCTHEFIPVWKI